jgi:hypothetical protein
MTFQVNAFGPSNVEGIYRIVEADDGKLSSPSSTGDLSFDFVFQVTP